MNFEHSAKTLSWIRRVEQFLDQEIRPAMPLFREQERQAPRFKQIPVLEELKSKAKSQGLWNMFMPPHSGDDEVDRTFEFDGEQLTNLEYAPLAEIMGRIPVAGEVFNCSAPDTGNMEVLMRYGTRAQKEKWLRPLMNGVARSAFLMTEPNVASSDARNIQTDIRKDGDEYVINGSKWWSSGAGHPKCLFYILMGKTNANERSYRQQSMVIVSANTPGITIRRMLPVFGYDHAQHGGHAEIVLKDVRVSADNILLGEGCGFQIAQGRLGPGRIHHAMRTIGVAEDALEKMCRRLKERTTFGQRLSEQSIWEQRIAEARIDIEMSRLLCLKAAYMMDVAGNKAARAEIAMIKVGAPRIALKIIDDAIQAHGGAGVCDDYGLAEAYANMRILRLADGPDEVHCRQLARMELEKYPVAAP